MYEDPQVELSKLNSGPEARSEKPFGTGLQFTLDAESATSEGTKPDIHTEMENIKKYSGIGGGTTQKSFK